MLKSKLQTHQNYSDADIVDVQNFAVTYEDAQCIGVDNADMSAVPLVLLGQDEIDKIRFSTRVLTYE